MMIVDGSGTEVMAVTIAGLHLGVAIAKPFSPGSAPDIKSLIVYEPVIKFPELLVVIEV
jgi:hypothetical protein